MTSILEISKASVAPAFGSASAIPFLLTRGPAGAVVNHVATQCQDQGRLLEEAKRDLEVFKKAYYETERDMHDRVGRFEKEKQALRDEIHQLKVRTIPPTHIQHDVFGGCFKLPRHTLMPCMTTR